MRICLYTESLEPSGIGEHMLTLARCFVAGNDVTFVAPATAEGAQLLARASALGATAVALDGTTVAAHDVARFVADGCFDVFHCHAGVTVEAHAGTIGGCLAGAAVVRTEHQPDGVTAEAHQPAQATTEEHRRRQRAVYAAVHRLVAVSDGVAATLRPMVDDAARLRVVRNGVDATPSPADGAAVRRRLGVGERDPLVVTVGRLRMQKGYHHLVEALPAVVARHPDAVFAWAGHGPLEPLLRVRARELGVDGHVRFLGHGNDVGALLTAADLFVLPSLWEGLPLAALEAMAVGLPVVATAVCGTSEVVVDGVTGRLVPSGEPHSLAAAVVDALDGPSAAREWGAAGRARFEAEFTSDRMADETLRVYGEARREVGRPQPRATPTPSPGRRRHVVRVGIVGGGQPAVRHFEAFASLDGVTLVDASAPGAVPVGADPDPVGTGAADRWSSIVDPDRLDALVICLPGAAAAAVEAVAIERGLPFLEGGPLSVDVATAEAVATAAAERGVVAAVGHHWRHLDIVERARALLGATGPVRLVTAWTFATEAPRSSVDGGGGPTDELVRVLDLAGLLAGDVAAVAAEDGEGAASVIRLTFASGALGTVASTPWPRDTPPGTVLRFACDEASVELRELDLVVELVDRFAYRASSDPFLRQAADFVAAVTGAAPGPRVPYEEGIPPLRLLAAAGRAAGRRSPATP